MSIKSLIQILIIFCIILIIGIVYYKYFETKKNIVEEISATNLDNNNQFKELEEKISDGRNNYKKCGRKRKNR